MDEREAYLQKYLMKKESYIMLQNDQKEIESKSTEMAQKIQDQDDEINRLDRLLEKER